jgi:integrase
MTRPRRVLTLARAADRYLASLELDGARPRTIDAYRRVLDGLVDLVGPDVDPFTLTRGDLLDVAASWGDVQPSTRAPRISVLRGFSAWLVDEAADRGIPMIDPSARLKRPRITRPRRPRPEGPAAIPRLCAACIGYERVVVWPLAMLGLRLSELRDMRWRDVDEHARILHVHGKGGDQVVIQIELHDEVGRETILVARTPATRALIEALRSEVAA